MAADRIRPQKSPLPPPRFRRPAWWQHLLVLAFLGSMMAAFDSLDITQLAGEDLQRIPQQMLTVGKQMLPPSCARLGAVSHALVQTLEMALVGNVIGLPLSLLLAVLAARNLTPHTGVYYATRGLLTLLRTTPALVWALFLIVAVGLGPRSGTLTLVLLTMGFCGRFFAEAMEEVNAAPQEALTALGATKTGILFCAVLPAALPSCINTALFNLEHSTRSSTVLGIVGAGGIGIELMVSLKTFRYDEAATILLLVFLMVMMVEQVCAAIRRRMM
jgi:phosphonate transport system permease protein